MTMTGMPIPRPGFPRKYRQRLGIVGVAIGILICIALFRGSGVASADAAYGVGLPNVTTNGFTHQWLGGYETNAGIAFCIETARGFPRATGNVPASDLPASRGVPIVQRHALSYALWAYSHTLDSTTAAGLAVVVHGLSGDDNANPNVGAMTISSPIVKQTALAITNDAWQHASLVADPNRNPWRISATLTRTSGLNWNVRIRVTTSAGQPVGNHQISVVPGNITSAPGTAHVFTTDSQGGVQTTWRQHDPFAPITVDVAAKGPGYYQVWKGPNYPHGTIPQQIVTSSEVDYRAHAQASLPTGSAQVHKATTNPSYQQAIGATFAVTAPGHTATLGTLTIGAQGTSNALTLPIGDYLITEKTAPPGVDIDPTPHRVTVRADATTTLQLVDAVRHDATLRLQKIDAITKEPVAGATLLVARDSDANGSFETVIGTYVTTREPITLDDQMAGNYQVTETHAPVGYLLPKDPTQIVSLPWNQTSDVKFVDHRIPRISTQATFDQSASGHTNQFAQVGTALHDRVTVTGLGPNEHATVHVALFGPADSHETLTCDANHLVWEETKEIIGSVTFDSSSFTPRTPGRFGYVATLNVVDVGAFSGTCGDQSETSQLVPPPTTTTTPPPTTSMPTPSTTVPPTERVQPPPTTVVLIPPTSTSLPTPTTSVPPTTSSTTTIVSPPGVSQSPPPSVQLPATGAKTRTIGEIGLVLTAAGALIVATRRRRYHAPH